MTIQTYLIIISWTVFLLVWGISSFSVKKDVPGKGSWYARSGTVLARLILAALLIAYLAARSEASDRFRAVASAAYLPSGPVISSIGAALALLGVAFAIWARFHLGRNWSPHPALKEGHELVTSGPYRVVRHPIYTGVLLALIGSGLVAGIWWIIPSVFGCCVFVARIFKEEKIMTAQFPDQYPEYRKRTWALVPFIF